MNEKGMGLNVGQRVRIVEEEEEDNPVLIGKMAIVERVDLSTRGVPTCEVRIDRSGELVSLPQKYLKPVEIVPSSLLANDLSVPWDPEPKEWINKYADNNWLAAHILEDLLFYNQLVVPTVDFSIIVPLVHWLGAPILKELMTAEAVRFVRTSGCLGYAGNGVGLQVLEIRPGKGMEEKEPWWVKVSRCSPKEAVALQLHNRLSGLNDQLIDILGKLVEVCTVDTVLPEFNEKVMNETYRDIQGSRVLTDYFFERNPSINTIALNKLPGVEPNQIRVFSLSPKRAVAGDEIDTTLRLAMLNLEAYLAEEAGARDMVTDRSYGQLLRAKAERYTGGRIAQESFSSLLRIENMPDIVPTIMSGKVAVSKVWQFRNTRTAEEFREWFDQIGPTDPKTLSSEYVKSLKSAGFWSSWKGKALRFITLQAIAGALAQKSGGTSFIASFGLSAMDCFLIDKIRLGFRPRYFVDELRNLFPE
jgi:hypothetical protein